MRNFGPELAKGAGVEAQRRGAEVGKKFGLAMVAGVATVAGGAVLAGKALYNVGATFDEMADTIRVGTGATGKNLDALVASAKSVGRGVPASFEDVGTTVADVNTRLGLTGPTLEKVSKQFLELGRITGEEIDIQKTTSALSGFGIEGEAVSGALDTLYQVSQASGVSVADLSTNLAKNGAVVKQLGLSFEESAVLVGSLDKAGVNSQQVMASMARGLVSLAKEGEKPQEAFKRVTGEMESLIKQGRDSEAINLAGKMFGTRGAPQMVAALKSGTISFQDLSKMAGQTGDTILGAGEDTADFAEQWQIFKNQVLLVVEPLASKLFGTIGSGMQWINQVGIPAVKAFAAGWQSYTGVGGRARVAIDGIVGAVRAVAGALYAARVPILILAGLIAAVFIPHWIALGVQATISSVKQAAAWVATQAGAVRAAAVHSAQVARMVGGWIALGVQATIAAGRTVASNVASAASFVAHRVAMLAGAAAAGVMRLAQMGLNAAMRANPIGLVITALMLLVGALVWAWNNSETFRRIVMAAWNGIKTAASAVAAWFTGTLVPALKAMWDRIVAGFNWLRDVVVGAFRFMVTTVVNSAMWWRDTVVGLATNIRDWIIDRFESLRRGAEGLFQRMVDGIRRIWDGLKAAASKPVRFVIDTVINNGIIKGWNDLVGLLKLPDNLKVGRVNVPGFARGGVLPGQASGRGDNMLVVDGYGRPQATVRSGEAVIPEAQTRAYARSGMLNKIIRGVPGFFLGGVLPTPGPIRPHGLPYYGASWAGDMGYGTGSPIYAWKDGTVAYTKRQNRSYGWETVINHAGGASRYAHQSEILVAAGQLVKAGQLIGRIGYSGNVRPRGPGGAHLHFETMGRVAAFLGNMGSAFDMAGQWLMDKLSAPVKALIDKVPGAGVFVDAAKGMGNRLLDGAMEKIRSIMPSFGEDTMTGMAPPGGAVERWRPNVIAALAREGLPASDAYVNAWLRQIKTESGGNPNAVQGNIGDINNRTGDIAKGLVQVIGATFAAYRNPALPNNRFNPDASLSAGMRYARARYGSRMLSVIGRGRGYWSGTNYAAPGLAWVGERGPELVDFRGGERVYDAKASKRAVSQSGNSYTYSPILPPETDPGRQFEDFAWKVEMEGALP